MKKIILFLKRQLLSHPLVCRVVIALGFLGASSLWADGSRGTK